MSNLKEYNYLNIAINGISYKRIPGNFSIRVENEKYLLISAYRKQNTIRFLVLKSVLREKWELTNGLFFKGNKEKMFYVINDIYENGPIVKNVTKCPFCRGTVNRFQYHIECENCHAYGDLTTFIMQKDEEVNYENRL